MNYFLFNNGVDTFQGDFYKYQRDFYNISSLSNALNRGDPLYHFISYLVGSIWKNFHFFIYVISFFFYFSVLRYVANIRKDKNFNLCLILIVIFLPWFFAYNALLNNVLRQGIVIAFLFSFLFIYKDRSFVSNIFILVICSLIHKPTLLLIPVILMLHLFKKRSLLWFFLISSVIYILNFESLRHYISNALLMGNVLDHSYLLRNFSYETGFNIYKFSALIFPLFFYFLSKERIIIDKGSKLLWNYYFIIGALSMLSSSLPYHDRFMLYAWSIIPILALMNIDKIFNFLKKTK